MVVRAHAPTASATLASMASERESPGVDTSHSKSPTVTSDSSDTGMKKRFKGSRELLAYVPH